MNAINHSFWSYYEVTKPLLGIGWPDKNQVRKEWETKDGTVSKIRLSPGYPVTSFTKLVEITAKTGLFNRQYEFFYRGQNQDYKDKNGKTIIYPAICRPDKNSDGSYKASVKTSTIKTRFNNLQEFILFYGKSEPSFVEYAYALIQHYDILPTPLIDITQSLRVAASFALRKSTTGYLYMFGLPYPHGSISHFIDIGATLVKLQNATPVSALRPRYQEGFLVGRLPFRPYKDAGDKLARRLIGKFLLDNSNKTFWDDIFPAFPEELLFPENDEQERRMKTHYQNFKNSKQQRGQ